MNAEKLLHHQSDPHCRTRSGSRDHLLLYRWKTAALAWEPHRIASTWCPQWRNSSTNAWSLIEKATAVVKLLPQVWQLVDLCGGSCSTAASPEGGSCRRPSKSSSSSHGDLAGGKDVGILLMISMYANPWRFLMLSRACSSMSPCQTMQCMLLRSEKQASSASATAMTYSLNMCSGPKRA